MEWQVLPIYFLNAVFCFYQCTISSILELLSSLLLTLILYMPDGRELVRTSPSYSDVVAICHCCKILPVISHTETIKERGSLHFIESRARSTAGFGYMVTF